ncbi:MAG: hypothetical protein WA269_06080 [Candidatus Udaeobacter sp.]
MLRINHISTHDLDEDMRLSVDTDDVSRIRLVRVERSGDISFIKKNKLTHMAYHLMELTTHENEKKVDQTDAQNGANLF